MLTRHARLASSGRLLEAAYALHIGQRWRSRDARSFLLGRDLRLRLIDQRLAQARDADVVLVEHLATARVRWHGDQHLAILLQHVPVPLFEGGTIEEPPDLARKPAGLAHAPEEDHAVAFVDRRDKADDPERSARAGRGWIGNVEPA